MRTREALIRNVESGQCSHGVVFFSEDDLPVTENNEPLRVVGVTTTEGWGKLDGPSVELHADGMGYEVIVMAKTMEEVSRQVY